MVRHTHAIGFPSITGNGSQCGVNQTVQKAKGGIFPPLGEPATWNGFSLGPPYRIYFHQTLFCIRILHPSWRRTVKVKVNTGVTSTGERALRLTDEGLCLQLS